MSTSLRQPERALTDPAASIRLACVQHGDFGGAHARLASGLAETYGGQRYSVSSFERMAAGIPHLVVSLDAPAVTVRDGPATYVGIPDLLPAWLPGRWRAVARARGVVEVIEAFAPTHMLLRAADIVGCRVLSWANRRQLPTGVVLASRFDNGHPPNLKYCQLANAPNVFVVANHNAVATASMIECGLQADKAVAWDYPAALDPHGVAVKVLPERGPLTVVYAGMLIASKGVMDLVAGVERCRRTAARVRLVLCGDGPLRATIAAHPGVRAGWLEVAGVLPSDEILRRMRDAWAVVVPTRPEYPEALPLVITEALTTRTPVVLSDHPIFAGYFRGTAGTRFFRAGDFRSLAAVLLELMADATAYREDSEGTAATWSRLQVETKFHHVLERLARAWEFPSSRGSTAQGGPS